MRRPARATATVLAAVLAAALLASCTQTITGTPQADAGQRPTATAAPTATTAPAAASPTAAPGAALTDVLVPDVVADECLLTTAQFEALLGQQVLDPYQVNVKRGDGSTVSSCFAHTEADIPVPIGRINVYSARTGTPVDFVQSERSADAEELPGVGDATLILRDPDGEALHIAIGRFVITIFLFKGSPSVDAWRTAGLAAMARIAA